MDYRQLSTPWTRGCDLYSAPGSLLVKLTLGEAPESIPAAADIRRKRQYSPGRFRIDAIDRVLSHFSDRVRITRIHSAAASITRPGHRHEGFDELEQVLGLARTFRVDADHSCCITDLVDALRQIACIEAASPHYLTALPFATPGVVPVDEGQGWAERQMVRAAEALAYEPGDPAVIVAVVDSGVAQHHHELSGQLRAGLDTVQLVVDDLASGIKLVGDRSIIDTDPEDIVGHGTSCAAIICALGESIPPGLANGCRVMPIRVLGAAAFPGKRELVGIGAIGDIDCGMKSAIDLGAKVINMSFGTPESALDRHDPRPHADVVRYGLAHGCIMVAASGNSGKAERYSPAAMEGVIAVGAVDSEGKAAGFSTRGEHVALCAPGERVLSAGVDGYVQVTGTSFAAPFVSATAALLVSRAERRSFPLNGPVVQQILVDSAQPWQSPPGEGYGAGVLDAFAALQLLDRVIDRSLVAEQAYFESTAAPRIGGGKEGER